MNPRQVCPNSSPTGVAYAICNLVDFYGRTSYREGLVKADLRRRTDEVEDNGGDPRSDPLCLEERAELNYHSDLSLLIKMRVKDLTQEVARPLTVRRSPPRMAQRGKTLAGMVANVRGVVRTYRPK